jgi:2-amino-4-hydroxy-6-hydroxymethyldihydropteridine diphosphokinase
VVPGVAGVRKAYISAGSNLGDRKGNLEFAVTCLEKENAVRKSSSYFETEPVGYRNQPWFLNIVIEIETSREPLQLLDLCQSIEDSCGRVRTFPNAPRTLDLDILLFDDAIISDERLVIPHPRLQERRFVLEPLAQIAPDQIHPVLKKSIQSLLEICPDRSEIRQIL